MSTYVKDLLERVLWTCAQAGVAYLAVESASWEFAWAVPIAAGLAFLKGLLAKRIGTPDTAALGGGL